MLSITRKISNYNYSSNNNIQYIVIHDTGNYKDTAWANANYFNGGNRNASAHYFVDNNSIYQVVEDYNASWHCGDGHGMYGIKNHNSIGIEMCNSGGYISEKTMQNTIDLIKLLQNKYKVSNNNVVRHYDASRKQCPNNMSANNWAKWWEFKKRLTSNTTYSKDFIASVQRDLRHCRLFEGEANGLMDEKTKYAIYKFRQIVGLPEASYLDQSVVNALNDIVKRPEIGYNNHHVFATRFVQWWIGANKDGIYDNTTVSMVQEWQKKNKLNPDGIIGINSWNKILK